MRFKVMRPKDYDKNRPLPFPMWLSPKLDGLRGEFYDGSFWTKTGHPIYGLSEQTALLRPVWKVHLTGELLVPGVDFDTSSGNIRSHSPSPKAVYYVFDAPGLEQEPFRRRLLWYYTNIKALNTPRVVPVSNVLVHTMEEVERMFKMYMAMGMEGIVLKTPEHLHMDGCNADGETWEWVRMKPFITEDVKVLDKYEGEGKHAGRLGGFIVENLRTRVQSKVGGGFTDQEREFYWLHFERYRGSICEISFQRKTKLGRYRHPNFVRFRRD